MKVPTVTLILGVFILTICLCGCIQIPERKGEESTGMINDLTWYLVHGEDIGPTETLINGTIITAFFDANGTVSGSAGCNQYSGTYRGGPDGFFIGELISTKMYCGFPDGIMEQESRYLSAMERAASYSVRNNTLDIRDGEGTAYMTFTAIPPDLVSSWRLVTFGTSGGQTWTPRTLTTITLRFHPDGTITGNAGCNDYFGTFQITGGNSLVIGTTRMTRMFCGIAGVMELEQNYSELLPEMKYYSVSNEQLLLWDTTGNIRMLFEKKPA